MIAHKLNFIPRNSFKQYILKLRFLQGSGREKSQNTLDMVLYSPPSQTKTTAKKNKDYPPRPNPVKKSKKRQRSGEESEDEDIHRQIKSNMVAFDKLLETHKEALKDRPEVMELLYRTPFGPLIKAFAAGHMKPETARKYDWDIKDICSIYDLEKRAFRFENGYSRPTVEDVVHIFSIPNSGEKKAPKSSSSRRGNFGEHSLQDDFFCSKPGVLKARLFKPDVEEAIKVALDRPSTPKTAEDAACLIIVHLLVSMLMSNSGMNVPWCFIQHCSSIDAICRTNWAKGILAHLLSGIHRSIESTERKGKQATMSGCVPLLVVRNSNT